MISINMPDTYKFPNGYETIVCKKQDILDCIDTNIIDKDIAYELISKLEVDIANFMKEGRWTGIPYMGNVRVPKLKIMSEDPERQLLINEAKEKLTSDEYVLFRKKLSIEDNKHIREERYYKYITSIAVSRNRKLYKKLCETKGEYYARLYLYSIENFTAINNEYVNIEKYDE